MKILLILRGREIASVIDLTIDLNPKEVLALSAIIHSEELAVFSQRRT